MVSVPGNHDPAECYPEMIGDLKNVTLGHDRVVTAADLDAGGDDRHDDCTIAGLGCEETGDIPELATRHVSAIDPRSESDRRHAADVGALALENAVFDYVTGDDSKETLLSRLEVRQNERQAFFDGLAEVERRLERLGALFEQSHEPDIFLSHVPPYNTALDRHRSVGEREVDLEGLHVGSLAVKITARKHEPFAVLSGHSHNREYEIGTADSAEQPHFLGLGFRGVSRITVDPATGAFAYEFL